MDLPTCPYCDTVMSLTTRDHDWHVCPECSHRSQRKRCVHVTVEHSKSKKRKEVEKAEVFIAAQLQKLREPKVPNG